MHALAHSLPEEVMTRRQNEQNNRRLASCPPSIRCRSTIRLLFDNRFPTSSSQRMMRLISRSQLRVHASCSATHFAMIHDHRIATSKDTKAGSIDLKRCQVLRDTECSLLTVKRPTISSGTARRESIRSTKRIYYEKARTDTSSTECT